jgi:DNA-binding Lrp family transcriptional regulator
MREMDPEEFAVYEKIEEARDRGITAVDLRLKLQALGFTQTTLAKVLKRMEKKGSVKRLKSLQQKHKQVYMLMEVEPSAEVTGGLVNTEAFDLEAIEVIHARILEYLKAHGNTSYREIALYVKQMGVLKGDQSEYKDEHIR